MLDIKKLRVECLKTLHSETADDIQEWLDEHRKTVAQAELEKKRSHLSGVTRAIPVQPRAANGRFASKKTSKPATRPAKTLTATRKKKVAV